MKTNSINFTTIKEMSPSECKVLMYLMIGSCAVPLTRNDIADGCEAQITSRHSYALQRERKARREAAETADHELAGILIDVANGWAIVADEWGQS